MSAGVPTVWLSFADNMQRIDKRMTAFRRAVVSGSPCPSSLTAASAEQGISTLHGWESLNCLAVEQRAPSRGYSARPLDEREHISDRVGPCLALH